MINIIKGRVVIYNYNNVLHYQMHKIGKIITSDEGMCTLTE